MKLLRAPLGLKHIALAGALVVAGQASAQDENPFGGSSGQNPFATAPAEGASGGGEQGANPFGGTAGENPFLSQGEGGDAPSPFDTPTATGGGSIFDEDAGKPEITAADLGVLSEWRYVERQIWNGDTVVRRVQMPSLEAKRFDAAKIQEFMEQITSGDLAGYASNSSPRDWAEWAYYSEQLRLWSDYVGNVVLVGKGADEETLYDGIEWPGESRLRRESGGGDSGGEGRGGRSGGGEGDSEDEDDEEDSIFGNPEQAGGGGGFGEFPGGAMGGFPGGGGPMGEEGYPGGGPYGGGPYGGGFEGGGYPGGMGGYPGGGGMGGYPGGYPGGGGGAGGSYPAVLMENQVVDAYKSGMTRLREMEMEQQEFVLALIDRLDERQYQRGAYWDWIEDQNILLTEYVDEWSRRYNGAIAMVGGIRYELYRPGEAPEDIRQDATVVITDYELTPYDILNPDGTPKVRPSE